MNLNTVSGTVSRLYRLLLLPYNCLITKYRPITHGNNITSALEIVASVPVTVPHQPTKFSLLTNNKKNDLVFSLNPSKLSGSFIMFPTTFDGTFTFGAILCLIPNISQK